uniref:Uncharacterized protein n=1 Tax=Rhodnius prolixus TaxID=13249 RepID=T1HGI5_RHOPR
MFRINNKNPWEIDCKHLSMQYFTTEWSLEAGAMTYKAKGPNGGAEMDELKHEDPTKVTYQDLGSFLDHFSLNPKLKFKIG